MPKNNKAQTTIQRPENETFEGVGIIYRNFSGRPTPYKAEGGVRDFCVRIEDPERAQDLIDKGWYIKEYRDRETGEVLFWYLRVTVSYRFTPPEVYQLVPGTQEMMFLGEDLIGNLDHADIDYADLTVSASRWEMNGRTGIKAYLQSMYVMPRPSRFSKKYGGYHVNNAQQPETTVPQPSTSAGIYDDEIPF